MMDPSRKPNRLVHEKSPYLLQHAYNPVDWYSWGEEAFACARTENKPILLSVGYSTCHWCHVMESESFENNDIAAIMNELFICIKVDREERPDVDRIYMTALQAMGQNGGWPMTMFLRPDLRPFYGGTYFPPESRYGRAGFPDVLRRIAHIWKEERAKVDESADGITRFLQEAGETAVSETDIPLDVVEICFEQMRSTFDHENGGFGTQPKFPRPVVFEFLLRYWRRTGNAEALEMCALTLRRMAAGGMHDHIGGGFHRYSVDDQWRVPHFEKMLYDQAQLAHAYLDMFQATRSDEYAQTARDILGYVARDLTSPEGGFFAAEDADSAAAKSDEKREGAFYVWTRREIDDILGKESTPWSLTFGVEHDGNVALDLHQEFIGQNVLYCANDPAATAEVLGQSADDICEILRRSREKLFAARARRTRPHRDEKIIAGWNGLMVGAFARGGDIFDDDRYRDIAKRAAGFLLGTLYDSGTRRLHRRISLGEVNCAGQLDDYTFMTCGLLDLFQSCGDPRWLSAALDLTEDARRLFGNETGGGFYDSPEGDSSLLVRLREHYDGAEPTGNAMAAMNALRLASLTGHQNFREAAESTLRSFGDVMRKQPVVMPFMVAAFDQLRTPYQQIVLVGSVQHPATVAMRNEIARRYLPHATVVLVADDEHRKALESLAPFAASLHEHNGHPTAYVCTDFACSLPVSDVGSFSTLLDTLR